MDATLIAALAAFFASPYVVPVLLALGLLGLLFELKAGAAGVGALVSLLSFSLFFGSTILLGHAAWTEVGLLVLAMLCVAVEAFLIPGFGVAGVLGGAFLLGAIVLALNGLPGSQVSTVLSVLSASVLITASVFFAWLRHLPTSTRFAGLFHRTATERAEGFIAAPVRDELLGRAGTAVTDLRPAGVVEIDGERIDVVTEGEFVRQGTPVTVVAAEGYRHVVRAAAPAAQLTA